MKTKVVFITNILRQPRCIRRIQDFIDRGYGVKVYGFDRGGDCRVLPPFAHECIGVVSSETSYLKRLFIIWGGISKVIRREGRGCLYYLFSLDNAIVARLACQNLKYIYEISDLMELTINNKFLSRLLVRMNRETVKHAILSVYTSEGFVQFLNPKGADPKKSVVLPNKLNASCRNKLLAKESPADMNHIRFGFVGAIRTETTYNLIKAIGECGKHEVHLYGIFTDENNGRYSIRSLVGQYKNVFYHGPFRNPDDLPKIYSQIDIVLCYYKSSENDLYLEPNKLYEAIYFDCPIIVADDTFVGGRVRQLHVGYTIERGDAASLNDFITSINQADFDEKVAAIKAISKDDCIDNPQLLFDRLKSIQPFVV